MSLRFLEYVRTLGGGYFSKYKNHVNNSSAEIISTPVVKEALNHAKTFNYLNMIKGWWSPSFGVRKAGTLCGGLLNIVNQDNPDSILRNEYAANAPTISYQYGLPVISFNGINQHLGFFNSTGFSLGATDTVGRWIAYAIIIGHNDNTANFFTNTDFASIQSGTTSLDVYIDDWRHEFGIAPNQEYRSIRGGPRSDVYIVIDNTWNDGVNDQSNRIINALPKAVSVTESTSPVNDINFGGRAASFTDNAKKPHQGQLFEFMCGEGILTSDQMYAIYKRLADRYGQEVVKASSQATSQSSNWNQPLSDLTNVPDCFTFYEIAPELEGATQVIELRRDSDDAEQWFGFGDDGKIDQTAIETWLNGATGYVKTWKNFGSGNDLVQTNNANQGFLVFDTYGRPTITFPLNTDAWLEQSNCYAKQSNDFITCLSNKGALISNQRTWTSFDENQRYYSLGRGVTGRYGIRKESSSGTTTKQADNNHHVSGANNNCVTLYNEADSTVCNYYVINELHEVNPAQNGPFFNDAPANTLVIGNYIGATAGTYCNENGIQEMITLSELTDFDPLARNIGLSQAKRLKFNLSI